MQANVLRKHAVEAVVHILHTVMFAVVLLSLFWMFARKITRYFIDLCVNTKAN